MSDNYTTLHKRELTRSELMPLTWAIEYIGKSISAHNVWESMENVKQSQRYLTEFLGNMLPAPTLTEAEANMAMSLHSYMRKCMDCPLGTLLYQLIAENRGTAIWISFCKGLVESNEKEYAKRVYQFDLNKAKNAYQGGYNTTDDLYMLSTLQLFEDDFVSNAWESVC